jgi:hypothetical protein
MYAISADIRAAIAELCREYQVKELLLFGSAAREDFRPESDLDLLVDFAPNAAIGFIEFLKLEDELAAVLGRRVDLVPKAGLKPAIRDEVLAEARVVYAG